MARDPHLNQPGGRDLPGSHPHVRGRERELRALADAVRRVIRTTVTHQATPAETADFTRRLEALAAELEAKVPAESPERYLGAKHERPEPHDVFPYDVMLGLYNPIAPPIEMEWLPPKAVGRAHFDDPYEGPPGCVHGAVLAAAFDQVFNVANISGGTAGPTANLTLEYRRPTPLHRDLVFEAWVHALEGRKVHTRGHVMHEGEITVEARGLFIRIDPERIQALMD